jgi:hypothetical protein
LNFMKSTIQNALFLYSSKGLFLASIPS